jgi:hypothetical protein
MCLRIPPLARLTHYPEMTPVGFTFPPLPAVWPVAPMPLIIDDSFPDHVREHRLTACSVSWLTQAGAWSARQSRSGSVPASMIAEFTDDPDHVVPELLSKGFAKRGKSGGLRIAEGRGLTVVNAKEVTEKVTRDKAVADQVRAANRERKRRQRNAERAERAERMAAGVTQKSRGKAADVTRDQMRKPKKSQVKGGDVTRDIGVTSRVTSGPSRARADFDFDFDLDPGQVSQSGVVDADAREAGPEPGTPEFRLRVIAEFAGRTGTEIDDRTADALAAEVLRKATEPVPNPLGYVIAAIKNERDPCARWLPKPPARTAFAEPLAHCGDPLCSPVTRRREHPETGADDGPCPKCSNSAATWKAS